MRALVKPPALTHGSAVSIVSTASPADPERLARGRAELARLGYSLPPVKGGSSPAPSAQQRLNELLAALQREELRAVIGARGGYGTNYLVETLDAEELIRPTILLGYSDITALQIFLWQTLGWVTFYGPMVASGFDAGADAAGGYDSASFARATTETAGGWTVDLRGESLVPGYAEGTVVGGCLTLVECSLGTPWELETGGTILLLEDRGMKLYQIDRALMHLKQAGKFGSVRAIVLGDFPECGGPEGNDQNVRDVCRRILGELGLPVVWGAPIGHTPRPMLTIPLGVRARLHASGAGQLEFLEPAVKP